MIQYPIVRTLLVDQDPDFLTDLEAILCDQWPFTDVVTKCTKKETAIEELVKRKYDLLFLNVKQFDGYDFDLDKVGKRVKQTIYMADSYDFASIAINYGASGYLLKPVQEKELNQLMEECEKAFLPFEVGEKKASKQDLQDQIICIPTIEGAEFLKPEDIIRCEGLQKCTRIVTHKRSDIISSYNIGIFRKLLGDLGFTQPHKSHLINLRYIVKYHREGNITMQDNSSVPLSRRRKRDLFKHMRTPLTCR